MRRVVSRGPGVGAPGACGPPRHCPEPVAGAPKNTGHPSPALPGLSAPRSALPRLAWPCVLGVGVEPALRPSEQPTIPCLAMRRLAALRLAWPRHAWASRTRTERYAIRPSPPRRAQLGIASPCLATPGHACAPGARTREPASRAPTLPGCALPGIALPCLAQSSLATRGCRGLEPRSLPATRPNPRLASPSPARPRRARQRLAAPSLATPGLAWTSRPRTWMASRRPVVALALLCHAEHRHALPRLALRGRRGLEPRRLPAALRQTPARPRRAVLCQAPLCHALLGHAEPRVRVAGVEPAIRPSTQPSLTSCAPPGLASPCHTALRRALRGCSGLAPEWLLVTRLHPLPGLARAVPCPAWPR